MNISNSISYEPKISRNESSDMGIKQAIPAVQRKSEFKTDMKRVEKKDNLDKVVDTINKSNKELKIFDRKLEISIHAKTKEVMVKVINTVTDEVIRELPPESVLDTVAYRKEIAGMLVDKRI